MGACDIAEACNGATNACPADGFVAAGTTCRASAGVCDVAETCTGSAPACPVDSFAAAGTVCVAASCSGTTYSYDDTCNGSGTCVDGGTQSCPGGCGGGTCLACNPGDEQSCTYIFNGGPICPPLCVTQGPGQSLTHHNTDCDPEVTSCETGSEMSSEMSDCDSDTMSCATNLFGILCIGRQICDVSGMSWGPCSECPMP